MLVVSEPRVCICSSERLSPVKVMAESDQLENVETLSVSSSSRDTQPSRTSCMLEMQWAESIAELVFQKVQRQLQETGEQAGAVQPSTTAEDPPSTSTSSTGERRMV